MTDETKKTIADPILRAELERYQDNERGFAVKRITEEEFINRWLPIFATRDMKIVAPAWLEVAVRINLPVDVVNDNGEVIYRIPPMLATDRPFINRGEKIDVGKQAENVIKIGGSLPQRTRSLFYKTIINNLQPSPTQAESQLTIEGILQRYGYGNGMADEANASEDDEDDDLLEICEE